MLLLTAVVVVPASICSLPMVGIDDDLTDDEWLVITAVDAVDVEKLFLLLLFSRAVGLGINETLPSISNEPVPNDAINEFARSAFTVGKGSDAVERSS